MRRMENETLYSRFVGMLRTTNGMRYSSSPTLFFFLSSLFRTNLSLFAGRPMPSCANLILINEIDVRYNVAAGLYICGVEITVIAQYCLNACIIISTAAESPVCIHCDRFRGRHLTLLFFVQIRNRIGLRFDAERGFVWRLHLPVNHQILLGNGKFSSAVLMLLSEVVINGHFPWFRAHKNVHSLVAVVFLQPGILRAS